MIILDDYLTYWLVYVVIFDMRALCDQHYFYKVQWKIYVDRKALVTEDKRIVSYIFL